MPRLAHALSSPNDKPSTGHYKITQFCYLPRYCRRYSTECLADHTAPGDKNEGNRLTVIASDRAGQSGFCCRLSAKRHWRLFCINDDGTTTDTVPNEVNGMDTYSNNGGYTSSCPIGQGRMKHWKVHRCRRSKSSAADRATVRWRVATGIRPPI